MKIGILGAGGWGTALAKLASECGHDVRLWARESTVVREILEHQANTQFLPLVELPHFLATNDYALAVEDVDMIISVMPSAFVRGVWRDVSKIVRNPETIIVSATKGFDAETLGVLTETIHSFVPWIDANQLVALSGPSFAVEVAQSYPTAIVAASRNGEIAAVVQQLLSSPYLRIYTSSDPIGVQVGGATKNVIAIAAGISDGLGCGENARAALITRGLAEMTRLSCLLGGQSATMAGLAGVGDLLLTCSCDLSRNRTVGLRLATGEQLDSIREETSAIAEGIHNASLCLQIAQRYALELPVTATVSEILGGRLPVGEAVHRLMRRDLKPE